MEFTGSDLMIKRNFYTQTGNLAFGMSCTVDNTTGTYHFGISGSQGTVDFTLQSGRVYYQDQFVHSYRSNQDFLIEAQFSSGKANVVKDSNSLTYGVPSPTGEFNYFYFNRANASLGAEFTLRVSGDNLPQYTITDLGYIYSTGQEAVTGYFVNQSLYPIRVFDSSFLVTQPYDFGKLVGNISPALTGIFTYTGDFDTFDLTQPITTTFNTNFGDHLISFNIVDLRSYSRFVQFQDITNYDFDTTGILSRDLFYSNYSGGFVTNVFNADLNFRLSYVSGGGTFTGSWDFLTGTTPNTLVSLKQPGQYDTGMISGSGSFQPNSSVSFQIVHNITGSNHDGCRLVISGSEVLNPIARNLSN